MKKIKLIKLMAGVSIVAGVTPLLCLTACNNDKQENNFDIAAESSKNAILNLDNEYTTSIYISSKDEISAQSAIAVELSQQDNEIANITSTYTFVDAHKFKVTIKFTGGEAPQSDLVFNSILTITYGKKKESIKDIKIIVKHITGDLQEIQKTEWMQIYQTFLTAYIPTIGKYKSVTFKDYDRFNSAVIETALPRYQDNVFYVNIKAHDWFAQDRSFGGITVKTMENIFETIYRDHPGATIKFYKFSIDEHQFLQYTATSKYGYVLQDTIYDSTSYITFDYLYDSGLTTLLNPTYA